MALRCVSRVPAFARHRALTARVSPLRSAVASPPASPPLSVSSWLSVSGVSVDRVTTSPSGRGLVLGGESPAQPGDVLCSIPEALCVTSADVAAHPTAGPLAEGRDALVGLALWLAAERHAGSGSQWCVCCASSVQPRVCVLADARLSFSGARSLISFLLPPSPR